MVEFNVAQLFRAPIGATRSYEIQEEHLQVDEWQVDNLRGAIRLTRLRGELLLQGWLEGQVILECSRCLEPYAQLLHMDMEVEFRPSVTILAEDESAELAEEEDGVYFLDGHHILDLQEPIREQVILNLPMQPLCRPDCAGLCPICGEDRNKGLCPGHPEQVDERMAALAALLPQDKTVE